MGTVGMELPLAVCQVELSGGFVVVIGCFATSMGPANCVLVVGIGRETPSCEIACLLCGAIWVRWWRLASGGRPQSGEACWR